MMENGGGDENQGMRHVMRQYCTGGASIEGQNGNSSSNSNKHSYFLRAKPPRSRAIDEEEEELFYKRPSSSSSSYHPAQSSEDEDLAADCLVMLSNKSDNQENRASSKNDHNNNTNNSSSSNISNNKEQNCKAKQQVVEKGMFQCKACKKVFSSHQALGGHRASHKKVKGCYAARLDGPTEEENPDDEPSRSEPLTLSESDGPRPGPGPATSNPRRTKMHECSVCRRVFSSGQALGGHKRCHWLTNSSDNAIIPHFHDFQYDHHQSREICKKKPVFVRPPHHNLDLDHELDLNLNLPAPQIHEKFDDGKTNKSRFEALRDLQQLANQNHQQKSVEVGKNDEKARDKELRKLSDLRDMNMDGGWLQMGIPY